MRKEVNNMDSQSHNCSYKGIAYPRGAEICDLGLCRVCTDEGFEVPPELSLNREETLVDPGEAYFSNVMG